MHSLKINKSTWLNSFEDLSQFILLLGASEHYRQYNTLAHRANYSYFHFPTLCLDSAHLKAACFALERRSFLTWREIPFLNSTVLDWTHTVCESTVDDNTLASLSDSTKKESVSFIHANALKSSETAFYICKQETNKTIKIKLNRVKHIFKSVKILFQMLTFGMTQRSFNSFPRNVMSIIGLSDKRVYLLSGVFSRISHNGRACTTIGEFNASCLTSNSDRILYLQRMKVQC